MLFSLKMPLRSHKNHYFCWMWPTICLWMFLMVTLEKCVKSSYSRYWCTMVARWLFELQAWGLPGGQWLRLHTSTARGHRFDLLLKLKSACGTVKKKSLWVTSPTNSLFLWDITERLIVANQAYGWQIFSQRPKRFPPQGKILQLKLFLPITKVNFSSED